MAFRYPQPDNEEGFEQLCLRLYRKVWNNESLKLYGKRGEKQDGIDIFDPLNIKPVRAVQCKHHEPTKTIPPSEIKAEVAKAEKSHFQIEHYVIATTARRSREAQDAVAELNLRADKQFTVDIEFWEEICQHAEELGRVNAELVVYGEHVLAGASASAQGGAASLLFDSRTQDIPEGNDPYTLIERLLDERRLDVACHELGKLPAPESLPTDQQYKLLRLRAKLALETGEFETASDLFLQAYAVSPDLDQAKQNRVLAYSLRCEPETAYEYAKQYVAEGLATPTMILRLIENVTSKEQLEEHEPTIRTFVATDAGINAALAHKHIQFDDYDSAYEAARRALSMESDSPQIQLTVAMSLHSLAVHRDPKKRIERLRLALVHYDAAADGARDQRLTTLLPEVYVNRAAAKALLGDESGAAADYRAAIDSATKPTGYVARAVGYFLQALDFDNASRMIGSLDRTTREGQYLALVAEYHSADTTAKQKHIGEMATLADQDWDRAVECRFQCVQWALELKEYELAASYVAEAFRIANPFQAHTMLAWIYLESGDHERARTEAVKALGESIRAAHSQELRLLASILVRLKDDANAIGLLEQLATPGVLDDDMKALLDSAQRLSRHDLLLRLCSELRIAEVDDKRLQKLELQLLSEYAPSDALALADEFIRSSDEPAYFVAARNVLAVRLRQPEKMNLDAAELPTAAQLPPREANLVLLPYVTAGMYDEALRFLHAQLRIYFEDEDAHGRYLFFFLRHEPKIQQAPPSTVANDCAALLEFAPGDRRWITLEDEQPVASRGEFASSSELGQRLVGRKVGDTIELPGNVVQVETASIRDIQTKYVRAFQDTFENFRRRFPGTSVLQRLQLGDPENFDPSPLIESLKSRREHIEECIAIYSEHPCSLFLFANSIGINELEAIRVLSQHPQGRVKSCHTTPHDFERALNKAVAPPAIVLSISSIVTIAQLDAWRYLESKTQYLISQLTSELIDEWIHEITDNHAEKGGTACLNEANQLVIVDSTPEVQAARLEELNMIRRMVDERCQKASSLSVAQLPPAKRRLYTEALGSHNLEAISVAKDHQALLWSDDALVGFVAETDFGVTNIWTQLALRCFMKWGGTMTTEDFNLATAKLAASDYENIIWNPETVIATLAGEVALWGTAGAAIYRLPIDVRPAGLLALSCLVWSRMFPCLRACCASRVEPRLRRFSAFGLVSAMAWLAIVLVPHSVAWGQPSRHRPTSESRAPAARAPAAPLAAVEAAPAVQFDGVQAAAILDALEIELVSLESGGADPERLARVEAQAREIERQTTSTSQQFRARRLARRAERAAKGRAPLASATSAAIATTPAAGGFATLAQFVSPTPGTAQPVLEPSVILPQAGYPAAPVAAPLVAPIAQPPTRHYVNLEALGWWVKGDQLPALVTTSPIGTPQAIAGVLGQPTTTVLFGNEGVNGDLRWGGRVQGGIWVDPYQTFAVEGHYYALASVTTTFSRSSTFSGGSLDDEILARPFFNNAPGVDAQEAVLVAFPDFVVGPILVDVDGTINVEEYSRIQSAGGGGRYSIGPHNGLVHLFVLGGYRFFQLVEGLSIATTSTPGSDPFPIPFPPGAIQQFDRFNTANTFNGGEIGLGAEMGLSRFSLVVDSRLALGNMHQTLDIDGRTSAVSGPFVASFEGGLLAQPTNIGDYSRDRFALIPSLDIKLGFQVLPVVRLTVGYNLTWVTNVLRPGEQIDTNVNTTQIAGGALVGPASPAATLDESTIWLQGFTTGLDMRF